MEMALGERAQGAYCGGCFWLDDGRMGRNMPTKYIFSCSLLVFDWRRGREGKAFMDMKWNIR